MLKRASNRAINGDERCLCTSPSARLAALARTLADGATKALHNKAKLYRSLLWATIVPPVKLILLLRNNSDNGDLEVNVLCPGRGK